MGVVCGLCGIAFGDFDDGVCERCEAEYVKRTSACGVEEDGPYGQPEAGG